MFGWFWSSSSTLHAKQRAFGAAENLMIKASQQYQGLGRVGEILRLEGPYIALDRLNQAIVRLQRRHPALRGRLQRHPTNPESFILDDDETLQVQAEEIPRKRDDHLDFWSKEWRQREKEAMRMGDGLAKIWLLQDPEDRDDPHAPREIVIMAEHCICDGISLSHVAHELLIMLSNPDEHRFDKPLPWSITMEDAIRSSLSTVNRFIAVGRFIASLVNDYMTQRLPTARIPFDQIDFDVNAMDKYCHTTSIYGILDKTRTTKLIAKCRQEGVTVTAAVISAVLFATTSCVSQEPNQGTLLKMSIGADTRRRCIPPVANEALSYHVSSTAPFTIPTSEVVAANDRLWSLARTVHDHMKASIDAGHILACGLILSKIFEKILGPINFAHVPTYGISSWGVLPFVEQYGSWVLTNMTPFVNLVRGPLPFTTIQTVNGILTLMFGGPDPFISSDTLMALRDQSIHALNRMIDN